MKESIKYVVLTILILIVISLGYSYAYFTGMFTNNTKETSITSGKVKLSVDDDGINAVDVAPIYDKDYELLAIHKNFTIISESTLNTCVEVYIDISEISESLKSEYFKYKLIDSNNEIDGTFENTSNGQKLRIYNTFIEGEKEKNLDLYIWISYQDEVDQSDMLNSVMKSKIYVKGYDAKSREECGL